MSHELDRILEAVRTTQRGIVVTLLRTSGSTYRRAGARAVIAEDGIACGLVSGGCIERDLAERMATWLADFTLRVVTYDSTTDADLVFGSGLGCRGTLELLIEPFDAEHPPAIAAFRWNGWEPVVWTTFLHDRELLVEVIRPPRALAVFGNGADVAPLVRCAESVGWTVTRFAASTRDIDVSAFDAAVVMTHNFLHDAELLELLLPSPIPYLGVLGPRRRREELLVHVSDAARAHAARLRGPIGLDLGGETPEEIALSIVAEVQAVLNGRGAGALQDRDAPIHGETPPLTWPLARPVLSREAERGSLQPLSRLRERTGAIAPGEGRPLVRPPPTCIVLAAGFSRRFGSPKQLYELAGEPLIRRAARIAREVAPTIVVIPPNAPQIREALTNLDITIIENEEAAEGLASSIRAGVKAATGDVLLLVCDQPGITPTHLHALVAANASIAASGYAGTRGVPAFFAAEHRDALLALRGDQGAKALLADAAIVPLEHADDLDVPRTI